MEAFILLNLLSCLADQPFILKLRSLQTLEEMMAADTVEKSMVFSVQFMLEFITGRSHPPMLVDGIRRV